MGVLSSNYDEITHYHILMIKSLSWTNCLQMKSENSIFGRSKPQLIHRVIFKGMLKMNLRLSGWSDSRSVGQADPLLEIASLL